MNEVPPSPACQAPALDFIIWYHSEWDVLRVWFLHVQVEVGRLGDSNYLGSELPGLTSWPGQGPQVGICSWCWVAFTRRGLQRRYWAVSVEPDGRLDEVLYKHTRLGLFATGPESGEGVGYLFVAPRM
jgi:hypothetical protein